MMHFAALLGVAIVALLQGSLVSGVPAPQTCYCIGINADPRPLYGCMDRTTEVGSLYADDFDDPCLLKAEGVLTSGGFVAAISNEDEVVYMVKDYGLREKNCIYPRRRGVVTWKKSCPPSIQSGVTLNPTPIPTTTTSTTTSTTQPPPTTTTSTTAKPTPSPTPPQTTKRVTLVPASVMNPSLKCDFPRVLDAIKNKQSVSHPNGNPCPMGGNTAESLLYQHCHAPSFDFQTWQIDLQVSAVCSQLKPGEPVGYYLNGNNQRPLGIMGVFMGCTSPTSFSVAMQDCFSGVDVKDVATTYLNPDYFYTFKWP